MHVYIFLCACEPEDKDAALWTSFSTTFLFLYGHVYVHLLSDMCVFLFCLCFFFESVSASPLFYSLSLSLNLFSLVFFNQSLYWIIYNIYYFAIFFNLCFISKGSVFSEVYPGHVTGYLNRLSAPVQSPAFPGIEQDRCQRPEFVLT